ncbi:MAG: hypothetical protein FWF29_09010 [Treponema sp.]|nr:hypothetical protein [Treponema sp.]
MKKVLLTVVLLAGITAASVFAWEPNDLTKYPSCTKPGDWILNLGIGFDGFPTLGSNYIYIPPLGLSFDKNVPLGDKGLPFFFGGKVGYWGRGYKYANDSWYYSVLNLAFRFGYHFNWDVDKLDTYAVTSVGWGIYMGNGYSSAYKIGWPSIGVNLGVRYFLTDWFGFWSEIGFGSYFSGNIGVSFKF